MAHAMRSYQQELFEECQKHNVICVLPTGSGKTLIAANMIKYTLEKSNNPKSTYAVFLVCTSPLVDQQKNAIRDVIPEEYSVSGFRGGNSPCYDERAKKMKNNITVMTADVFKNSLDKCPELLDTISILILDECHNARKGHPYRQLMTNYIPTNTKKTIKVLGLSASPAAKETTGETLINLLQLCHDMGCRVRQVTSELKVLNEHVHLPHPEVIKVDMDEQSLELRTFLRGILKPMRDAIRNRLHGDDDMEFESESFSQAMEVEQNDSAPVSVETSDDTRVKTTASSLVRIMCVLNEALIILDNRSARACWKHIEMFLEGLNSKDEALGILSSFGVAKSRFKLLDLAEHCAKRLELMKLLQEDTSKTALVFVKSQEDATELQKLVRTQLTNKCDILLGHGGDHGMTSFQQKEVVRKFKERESSVLIATSVAEEGLDIPSCDLVVRMHGVNTALELIQSRGRARNQTSEFITIFHKDSYDLLNMKRCQVYEKKMKHAIDILCMDQVEKRLEELIFSPDNMKKDSTFNLSSIFDIIWSSQELLEKEIESYRKDLNDENKTAYEPIQLLDMTIKKLVGSTPEFVPKAVGVSHCPVFSGHWKIPLPDNDIKVFEWPKTDKQFEWCPKKTDAKKTMANKLLDELKKRDLIIYPKEKPLVKQVLEVEGIPSSGTKKKSLVEEVMIGNVATVDNALGIMNNLAQVYGSKIVDSYTTKSGYFICTISLGEIQATSGPCQQKMIAKKQAGLALLNNYFSEEFIKSSIIK
jgi:ERCC4-related helicase